jgi:hypothetical protein
MIETHRKLDVALANLNTALRLYFETQEYFAVIQLAGAAEEVLGVHLRMRSLPSAMDEAVDAGVEMARRLGATPAADDTKRMRAVANRAKNQSKHMNESGDHTIALDPREEARSLLERAVDNFYDLLESEGLEETDLIRRFNASYGTE